MSDRIVSAPILAFALLSAAGGLRAQPDVVAVLKGHTDTVESVAVSPDGTIVATASFDRTVKLWDAAAGIDLLTYGGEQGHKGQVLAVAFNKNGDQIATGGADNFAKVWEAGTGFPTKSFAASAAVLGSAAALKRVGEFLPPKDRVAVRLKAAQSAPVKSLQHPNLVDCIAFDDTGNLLATGCHDGKLRIWDLSKNLAQKTIDAHVQTMPQPAQNPIYAVLWSPDHKQIFTASYDRTIKLWDVASGNLVREFKAAPDPKPIEPKKDDPKKAEPKKDDKKDPPKKVEPKKEEPAGPPGHRDQVFAIALTKDGKFLASGSSDRGVKLWDVATGRVAREFPNPDFKPVLPGESAPSHPGWVPGVRFTPDGQFLVTAGPAPRGRSYVAVWKVADGTRVFGAERDAGPIHSLAVTPDGARLVLGCAPVRGKTDAEALVVKFPGK